VHYTCSAHVERLRSEGSLKRPNLAIRTGPIITHLIISPKDDMTCKVSLRLHERSRHGRAAKSAFGIISDLFRFLGHAHNSQRVLGIGYPLIQCV
jgi:hypothetical protein